MLEYTLFEPNKSWNLLLTVYGRNLSDIEKTHNETKEAYEETQLQYEKEKTSREEMQDQLESERRAHDKTKAELEGKGFNNIH